MFCTSCGKSLKPHAVFCPSCGIELAARYQYQPRSYYTSINPTPLAASGAGSKQKYGLIMAICIVFVFMATGVGYMISTIPWHNGGSENPGSYETFPANLITTTDSEFPLESEFTFHYIFNSNVNVVSQPPAYNVVVQGNYLTITVDSPTHAIRQLTMGELFAFEPTLDNIEGLAGRVISVTEHGGIITIVARIPGSLDEIFYEFEMNAVINLLEYADEIFLDEALQSIAGLEMERNRTSRIGVIASNANIDGVVLNGQLQLFTPTVQARLNLNGVESLVLRTTAEINLTATAPDRFDRTFTLFTIPIRMFGTGIQVPVRLRVAGDGSISLEVTKRVDAEFGIRHGRVLANVRPTFSVDFEFDGRVTLTANIQARATVLLIPVYGVEGDFGKGIQSNAYIQDRCVARACLVIESFHVRRIRSLNNFGILSDINALQFYVDLARNMDTSYWYIRNGVLRRLCICDADVHDINKFFHYVYIPITGGAAFFHAELTMHAIEEPIGYMTVSGNIELIRHGGTQWLGNLIGNHPIEGMFPIVYRARYGIGFGWGYRNISIPVDLIDNRDGGVSRWDSLSVDLYFLYGDENMRIRVNGVPSST